MPNNRLAPLSEPQLVPVLVRGCRCITPYTAGFEDFRYQRKYDNPFRPDTLAWWQYDAGHEDAQRSKE